MNRSKVDIVFVHEKNVVFIKTSVITTKVNELKWELIAKKSSQPVDKWSEVLESKL